jgi:protein-S-isoprenylcysteine O-methyltransferase Ste14
MSNFTRKLILGITTNLLIYGVLLLVPAWTVRWWRAWVFLGVVLVCTAVTMVAVFRDRQELFNERLKPPFQADQPLADKIILLLFLASYFGLVMFIPLDVFRWHLMGTPGGGVAALGLALFVAGWWILSLAFKENPFAIVAVRHQEERHQTVVDTGVYGVVRHPLYAGGILMIVGMPLWLDSWAGAWLAVVPAGLLALRCWLEEEFLKRELKGYAAYMEKVRYRLAPYVW